MARYIVHPGETDDLHRLGGKAAALSALRQTVDAIPAWFVVTPEAFQASLTPVRRAAFNAACSAGSPEGVARALDGIMPSREVQAELEQSLAELCRGGELVAVRSSAVDEDGAHRSSAGQLDTFLDVPPDQLLARVVDVWRSGFGERVWSYRRSAGLSDPPAAPAVLVQRMVRARAAGVAFSADPGTGQRGIVVVNAVRGLGAALVSGECEGDMYRVDRGGRILTRTITSRADGGSEALSDDEVGAVVALALACERGAGRPQDVEWAIDGDRVYLLQSRPITTLAQMADPDGAANLWDNSNIAESYGGVTTPLTFSFARQVYEEVYRQLCRTLGASEAIILEHANTFRHMLGFMHGRVYYNLLSWYRLLALLPGFTLNRRFMEQMMGVGEGLPDAITAELKGAGWTAKVRDGGRLLIALVGLVGAYFSLPRRIQRFQARLDSALGHTTPDLSRARPDELVAYFRDLERQLITRWDAPLLNDLYAMMFFGLLRKLAASWCGDATGALENDLLGGEGGMVSAEPAARVREMAQLAARDSALVAALCSGSLAAIEAQLAQHPAVRTAYEAYLERFADRCLEELKLESPTLRDDPLPLLRSVGQLALSLQILEAPGARQPAAEMGARRQAERRAAAELKGHPLRRALFHWVLGNARRRVRDRENLRFERTRVFGRVRLIFVEVGRRLYALDLLESPRDIFYLDLSEVLGIVEGTATCTDLKVLASVRRAEAERFKGETPLGERFTTTGVAGLGITARPRSVHVDLSGDRRSGMGCCPGVVRGRVHIVADPRSAKVRAGEILVAERTDPGWIMLFPSAAGVLVERGSLLSHSAIVARELSIPTIVALRGVTSWLRDGEWVEMDGGAGTVTRIVPPGTEAQRESKAVAHA